MNQSAERVIVVSNRLPVTLRRVGDTWKSEASSGGLATAMNPILARTNGIWIGWPGDSSPPDDDRDRIVREWAEHDRYITVELPADVARLYYEGHANQALWPLFHQFPSLVRFFPAGWRAYVDANLRFRDAVVAQYREGDLIWVHDYHLMLLPQMLRQALPAARMGFFLHIPFPSSEVFRILPRREEVLEGLLGADLLGFQTHSHLQHFRTALLRVLGVESSLDRVEIGSRAVRLEAFPIGIAPEEFLNALASREGAEFRARIERRFAGQRLLLAVDRLDYTKGIPHRLRAYRQLLETGPELRRRIVLIQIAVPSREGIASYAGLKREVNELVGEINGQFSTPDWTPLIYMRRGVSRPQLAALYAAASVGWVTPLRDGMNLVAKEYVACQTEGRGALVLSEFAGAAEELSQAFTVNPYDEERTAETVAAALALPEQDRRERMSGLHADVLRRNVYHWGDRFLSSLREAAAARAGRATQEAEPLPLDQIMAAYRGASCRVLFLDYDGTLVGYASRPELATPPSEVLHLLERLAADPANCVVVISGRRSADLAKWFGPIPGLWLAAEHGATIRRPGQDWQPLRNRLAPEWKAACAPCSNILPTARPAASSRRKTIPWSGITAWPSPSSATGWPTNSWPCSRACWPPANFAPSATTSASRSNPPGSTRARSSNRCCRSAKTPPSSSPPATIAPMKICSPGSARTPGPSISARDPPAPASFCRISAGAAPCSCGLPHLTAEPRAKSGLTPRGTLAFPSGRCYT
jgi:trehalose 6-phosphate synthase/phosphatase